MPTRPSVEVMNYVMGTGPCGGSVREWVIFESKTKVRCCAVGAALSWSLFRTRR